jgi:hypothetical protein
LTATHTGATGNTRARGWWVSRTCTAGEACQIAHATPASIKMAIKRSNAPKVALERRGPLMDPNIVVCVFVNRTIGAKIKCNMDEKTQICEKQCTTGYDTIWMRKHRSVKKTDL